MRGVCAVSQRLTAMDIVELFEKDAKARKRLAELLVSEPDVRLAMINAILRDVATKHDIENLRNEFKQDIEKLRAEFRQKIEKLRDRVGGVEQRLARLEGRMDLLIKVFIGFSIPTLTAVIGILLKMVFKPWIASHVFTQNCSSWFERF